MIGNYLGTIIKVSSLINNANISSVTLSTLFYSAAAESYNLLDTLGTYLKVVMVLHYYPHYQEYLRVCTVIRLEKGCTFHLLTMRQRVT